MEDGDEQGIEVLLHWTWCLKVEERKGWYRFFFQIHQLCEDRALGLQPTGELEVGYVSLRR